jgi:hypothetical protein
MSSVPRRRRPIVAPITPVITESIRWEGSSHPIPMSPITVPTKVSTDNTNKTHYQMIDGFTRIPVASDGNCFYTATGFFCGLNAATMRHRTLKYLVLKRAEYSIFFESEAAFIKAIKENSMARIWNTDLADILPHAAAQLLQRDIIIHNYDGKSIKQIRVPYNSIDMIGSIPIHLFRSNCHYEILLENGVLPNKNIICLPDDVSDMSLVVADEDEMKEEQEDQQEDEGHYQEDEDHYQEGIFYDVEEEDLIPEDNEEECMIHF